MEYCCVGVIFLSAGTFAVLGLVFMLQYQSRGKSADQVEDSQPADNE